MIDHAGIRMKNGASLASERAEGCDDNMSSSHFHEYFEIYYLESGSRTYIINDREYKVVPGSIVLLPPYTMHYSFGGPKSPFCRLLVYFKKEVLGESIYNHLLHTSGVFSLKSKEQTALLHTILEEVLKESTDSEMYHELCAKSALMLALVMVLRNGNLSAVEKKDDKINLILRYLEDHYSEDISLDYLSTRFFMSKFFLCREFKKYTKTTVGDYLNSIRILNAQRLFMESKHNLSTIATLVGYRSLGNFERAFKKITGTTPLQSLKLYRRQKGEL